MADLATLTEGEFWPLIEQARDRVLTNDVDALEALIVAGLPPDEMQAAAWALVQRVRGLRTDLMRFQDDLRKQTTGSGELRACSWCGAATHHVHGLCASCAVDAENGADGPEEVRP